MTRHIDVRLAVLLRRRCFHLLVKLRSASFVRWATTRASDRVSDKARARGTCVFSNSQQKTSRKNEEKNKNERQTKNENHPKNLKKQ